MGPDELHEVQQGQVQGPTPGSGQPVSIQDDWIDNNSPEKICV